MSKQHYISFDVMLDKGTKYITTLRMPYCPLFPIDGEEVKAFILKKRPTLRNQIDKVTIAFNWNKCT